MKLRIVSLTILLGLFLAPLSAAQQKEDHKLIQFQMAIFTKAPKLETTPANERDQIFQQHVANVLAMYESGKMAVAGPFGDNSNLVGIFVMRAASTEEAKAWVDVDPAVKAGLMTAEIHPWWSEDIYKKAVTSPLKMETVYFGFLKKGANRKEGDDKNPEVQELQKAHLANINRLAETKKLVMAGPFGDDTELRGIFVFRVASLQEAQDLCATDPMVKIDRLRLDLHPWHVPVGVIP